LIDTGPPGTIEHMFVGDIRRELAGWVAEFEAALVSGAQAKRLVEDLAAIERLAAGARTMAAARVADTGLWRADGDRSAAHWLARETRTSIGEAKATLEAAERLTELPATAAAVRAGQLTPAQASAITDAATAAPETEADLLRTAHQDTIGRLRDKAKAVKCAGEDDAARKRRVHRHRSLYTRTDADGTFVLELRTTVDAGAKVQAVIEEERERLFQAARLDGRRESLSAYAADALVNVCARGGGLDSSSPGGMGRSPGSRSKVIARIDFDALVRGHADVGETCEIAGLGPVPVTAVRAMIDDGAFMAAVITKGRDVHTVAHLGRQPTAFQRTALEWRDPRCTRAGCTDPGRHLEIDHRTDWAQTHHTKVDDLDRLCDHDHDLKTYYGWALIEGRGRRPMVPPDDPRHPKYRAPP